MITQFKNWLKAKKSHDEKLWMQDQTNSNRIMNKNQETNTATILKIWKVIYEIVRKSDTIRIQVMKSWNITQKRNYIRKIINILTIIRKATRIMRLF